MVKSIISHSFCGNDGSVWLWQSFLRGEKEISDKDSRESFELRLDELWREGGPHGLCQASDSLELLAEGRGRELASPFHVNFGLERAALSPLLGLTSQRDGRLPPKTEDRRILD
ncbi:hypothetical protein IV203_018066 [Nitzschia inconspicua]|uniref:Uncharacterized protein n=1 Tax=Nitzschia inconspicua TaxID=303405 RepID=A0A9K3Q8C5_9STRA|nr:hypothetical protein IV203_018066 [Nitzschia inconspicua]